MFRWLHDFLGRNSSRHAAFSVIEAHIMEHPEEWQRDSYWFESETKKLALWIANGSFHCELKDTSGGRGALYSPTIDTPMAWRKRFWRATKGCGIGDRRLIELVARFDDPRAFGNVVRLRHGNNS